MTRAWLPPSIRDIAEVPEEHTPTSDYHVGDPVAVHIRGGWWPGVVDAADDRAVQVTWRLPGGGTEVDTLTAEYVRRWDETGPAEAS